MIPVFARDREAVAGAHLPEDVMVTSARESFEASLGDASCALIHCGAGTPPRGYLSWVRRTCALHPDVAILLVVSSHSWISNGLADMPCAGTVTEDEFAHDLDEILSRYRSPLPGLILQQLAIFATLFGAIICNFIQALVDPLGSPTRLVATAFRQTEEGESKLRRTFKGELGILPKRFIDWVLLWRGLLIAVEHPRYTSEVVARELGVHETTLDRLSRRLTKRTFAVNRTPQGIELTKRDFTVFLRPLMERAGSGTGHGTAS